jgi:Vacuolar-sorting associated protein 13, adaptor binding domain
VSDLESRCIGLDFGRLSIRNAAREALSPNALKKLSLSELHDRASDIYSVDVENVHIALSDSVSALTVPDTGEWDEEHCIIPRISLKSFTKLAFRPPKTVPRAEISAIAENVSATISDVQIQAIRVMITQLIPNFSDVRTETAAIGALQEKTIDPVYSEQEITRMRNKEAFLLAFQLDVKQAKAEITRGSHGLTRGQERFLAVNAAGLNLRMRVYAYNYWIESELHGATISTADPEPLLISDHELPIMKISYEDNLGSVPIGPGKRALPRILRCDIGKVRMNLPERIWEVISAAQKLGQVEGQIQDVSEGTSMITLPAELLPQDETLVYLDVDDVQVALWEEQASGNVKIGTLNLEELKVTFRQTSADAMEDDVVLRKMDIMVQRFTCRHHLHEDHEMCMVMDFGGGDTPATMDFTQFDPTSPQYPGWATAVNANISQDILFNVDQDPLSHLLRYIIKLQSRKQLEPTPQPLPPSDEFPQFKFDVRLRRVVANLFKPGTFRSHSRDHISLEIGNISAHDLIHPHGKLPTLAKVAIDPITMHSKTYDRDKVEELTILSQATINIAALLEKVIETETNVLISALVLRPYQLRMVLDLLGVIGQTLPLVMQAKDALTGAQPHAPVAPPPGEVSVTGKHTLHVVDLDIELVSGKSHEAMLALRLPDLQVIATMTSDGDTTVLLDLQSFKLMNPRSEHFGVVIPATSDSPYQLSLRAVMPQDKTIPMEIVATLVNPEIILDGEAIASVLAEVLSFKSELQEAPKSDEPPGPMPLIELTMQMPRMTLLEDSSDPNTNAITISAEYIALDTTDDSLFKVLHACVYQHQMQRASDPVLFVDHFGIDAHKEGIKWKGSIDPIIVRIAPRDIRLVLSLQKRLLPKIHEISEAMASSAPASKLAEVEVPEVLAQILSKSHYQLHLGGVRIVFIGDMPEIPILDWKIKQFLVDMQAWDNFREINVLTSTVGTSFNMYNFAKSKWEPVIEPWEVTAQIGFHQPPNPQFEFNVSSGKRLDFVMSTRTVDMVSLLNGMIGRIFSETALVTAASTSTAPYRIVNLTGLTITVWSDVQHPGGSPQSEIAHEKSIPWRFDSWRNLRDNVNIETEAHLLNIKLNDTLYNFIERVPVSMESQRPYRLKPSDTKVAHHVLCEVKLGHDNIKEVIVRSTYLIENASLNELEVLIMHDDGRETEQTIPSGETYSVPVLLAQSCRVQIRPPRGYGYEWSEQPFIWHDFLRENTRTLRCRSSAAASFNLVSHAVINTATPLATQYPFMTLKISTPLKLINLLPYDIKYHLYDKRLQEKFINTIKSGESSPVHSVELSHLLLMAVEVLGSSYEGSEYSVINADDPREFQRETRLNFRQKRAGRLRLGLHYLYPL